ncbi:flagellin N-terminal helical domain-containing protein [Tessaracoccus sp.]
MGLRINNNIAAMNAHRNLTATDTAMGKSLEKLSSGLRINRAADDAAGLAISEGLRAQIGGLKQATRNAQDGISVAQTAEGALTETTSILQRMRDLSVQAANGGSVDVNGQAAANKEFSQLKTELTRIAVTTKFGSQSLLDAGTGTTASAGYAGTFQVGANNSANDQILVDLTTATITANASVATGDKSAITGLDAAGLNLSDYGADKIQGTADDVVKVDLLSTANAQLAMTAIDKALKGVTNVRADLGAVQNRFEHTINNLSVATENVTASESRIRDVDMAQEMMSFTKSQILSQAGTAMLAQANQSSQGVLSLLR